MKKNIVLVLLLFMAGTVSLNAQITLYKGIKSGWYESGLKEFLNSSPDFTSENYNNEFDYYTTTINGKLYIFRPGYNKYSELYVIDFVSDSTYTSLYDENLRSNVREFYYMLQERYGDPVYDKWSEVTYMENSSQRLIYIFGSEPDMGGIKIERGYDGSYSVILSFEDMSKELLDDDTSDGGDDSDDLY